MMKLPAGIQAILNEDYNKSLFTEKVVNTIAEYYSVFKSYYNFDEAKFALIALDCAKKAKNENTFPSYFKYTLESDLFSSEEKYDFDPSPEFLKNEKMIMRAYEVAVWDYHDIKKVGETNECIHAAVMWAGYPDMDDRLWDWLPSYPIDSSRNREERDRLNKEAPYLVEFNGMSYHDALYYHLLSCVDGQRKEDWIGILKNWQYGVKILYKEQVDRYIQKCSKFDFEQAKKNVEWELMQNPPPPGA